MHLYSHNDPTYVWENTGISPICQQTQHIFANFLHKDTKKLSER